MKLVVLSALSDLLVGEKDLGPLVVKARMLGLFEQQGPDADLDARAEKLVATDASLSRLLDGIHDHLEALLLRIEIDEPLCEHRVFETVLGQTTSVFRTIVSRRSYKL